MEHRPLGRTGVSVSKLGLGTMCSDAADRLAKHADEAGISLVELAMASGRCHRPSSRRSSARAPWSTSNPSSPPPT
ncbi:hypothetical protein ACQSSU_22610 [Micromonospora echinospora]